MPEASLTFPAELPSVSAARSFLQRVLSNWDNGHYDFAAPLVLTELVTNATLHARSAYTVRLQLEPDHLLVEVFDTSPRLPQARHYAVDATTGRGINLVDAFSSTWGATPTPNGKVVWARVLPDESMALDLTQGDAVIAESPTQATPGARERGSGHGSAHLLVAA